MRGRLRAVVAALVATGMTFSYPGFGEPAGDEHAVILLYHHVSDETPASTSVSPAVFESHLDYLEKNGYSILPLQEIVTHLSDKTRLPRRSVAITFDDGYESILSAAMPLLAKRDWPFTVFVSTEAIENSYSGFMDWAELRRIEANGGTLANHTTSHDHLVRRQPGESATKWRQRITADIESAQETLEKELERPERLFAWPYGEFDAELEAIAAKLGYVSFGQQSGPAGFDSNMQRLPRFPMAAKFADLGAFAEKLRSRPLPATVVAPDSGVLGAPARPPQLKLRISDGPYRLADMRCYVSGQQPAKLEWRDDVVTVSAQASLKPGRGKFNCTAPSSTQSGVFYWYSHLWLQPKDDGSWYTE